MSSIRVNPFPMPDLLTALEQLQQQQDTATLQLSTGSKINRPSDDPAGAAELVVIQNLSDQNDSFQRSVSSLNGLFSNADSTLNSVETALQRAISLGTEGANGTLSDSDRAAIAAELTGIQSQLISLANTSYQGEYLFAGTAQVEPFTADSSSPSGVSYAGNAGTNQVAIGNSYSLQVNLPGSQVFSNSQGDVFQSIQDLITALQSNSNIATAVTETSNAAAYISDQRVFYDNALNQTGAQQTFLSSESTELTQQQSDVSATDLAATATELSQDQTNTTATLDAMAKLQQNSLFNYLQ
jgi:flagellar hook-associated protein 3 FlgL